MYINTCYNITVTIVNISDYKNWSNTYIYETLLEIFPKCCVHRYDVRLCFDIVHNLKIQLKIAIFAVEASVLYV